MLDLVSKLPIKIKNIEPTQPIPAVRTNETGPCLLLGGLFLHQGHVGLTDPSPAEGADAGVGFHVGVRLGKGERRGGVNLKGAPRTTSDQSPNHEDDDCAYHSADQASPFAGAIPS